jgi:hypothetical protein
VFVGNLDWYRFKKEQNIRKGNHRTGTVKTQYNFNLYADGIHPDNLLAKTWLKKITGQIQLNCVFLVLTDGFSCVFVGNLDWYRFQFSSEEPVLTEERQQ